MTAGGPAVDRRGLVASMVVAGVLGVLGIGWGIVSQSQMILLDGAYSIVGIALSLVLLQASALSRRGPSEDYQYGMEAAAPMAVGIQGFVMLATLLYAMYEAGLAIRSGGSEVGAGWGMAYGVLVTLACGAFTAWLARTSAGSSSDILDAETAAWRVATLRGVGMVVGFGVLAALEGSAWSEAAPYVDPAMVLLSCALLVSTPIGMIRDTGIELLAGAPEPHLLDPIEEVVRTVLDGHALEEPELHVSKVGPKIYVEVAAAADPDLTIREEHEVREAIRRGLATVPHEVWLTVELLPRSSPSVEG